MIKNIPATEYPSAHDAIQQIVDDLRILVIRINSATGNPVNKDRIQKTLILQSKIRFSQQVCVQFAKRRTKLINGHIVGLCPRCIQRAWSPCPLRRPPCYIPSPRKSSWRLSGLCLVSLSFSHRQKRRGFSSPRYCCVYLYGWRDIGCPAQQTR